MFDSADEDNSGQGWADTRPKLSASPRLSDMLLPEFLVEVLSESVLDTEV